MPRFLPLARPKNPLKTLLYTISSLIVAWQAAAAAFVYSAGQLAPAVALRIDPTSPRALTKLVDLGIGSNGKPDEKLLATKPAVSLRHGALNAAALRQMAMAMQLNGNEAGMRRMLKLSQRVSRRDAVTQVMLSEEAIRIGNLRGLLAHYDTMLRTNANTWNILFGKLNSAIAAPKLQRELGYVLKKNPPWARDFIEFSAQNVQQPDWLAATLISAAPLAKANADGDSVALLLARVADKGSPAMLRRLYLSLPGTDRKKLVSLAIANPHGTATYPPLDWEMMQSSSIAGDIVKHSDFDGLTISTFALPGERGVYARKILFLAPGRYHISLSTDTSSMAMGATSQLSIQCRAADGTAGPIQNRLLKANSNKIDLEVTKDCVSQTVDLGIQGGEGSEESRIFVGDIMLHLKSNAGAE